MPAKPLLERIRSWRANSPRTTLPMRRAPRSWASHLWPETGGWRPSPGSAPRLRSP